MRFNVKLSNKQALRIAENIICSGFFVAGQGCFDLDIDDVAELIKVSFNQDSYDKCADLFNRLQEKYMGV